MAKKQSSKKTRAAAKHAEVPVQPDDSQELVVFALRLRRAERDLIHQAAGPAKASRFARAILVAAARQDKAAVKAVMETVQGKA